VASIPIYNKEGNQVFDITIDDSINYISGRVSQSDKGYYYKGVGVPYKAHAVVNPGPALNILGRDPVFYCGYSCERPQWKGKVGIFQDRYQPYFSDFIGSCGPKELKLIKHSELFERSSVKVLDCIEYDEKNNQRYFIVDYKCGRRRYISEGNPKELSDLISYMIVSDWNFPWDKTAINDISFDGRVSDVADMFISSKLKHKVGTVYSILYSLSKLSPIKYSDLLKYLGMKHNNDMDYLFIAASLLDKNGINISNLFKGSTEYKVYRNILLNYLMEGRNCGHVEDKKHGDKVMQQYISMYKGV
jgi:hypothetical protein